MSEEKDGTWDGLFCLAKKKISMSANENYKMTQIERLVDLCLFVIQNEERVRDYETRLKDYFKNNDNEKDEDKTEDSEQLELKV